MRNYLHCHLMNVVSTMRNKLRFQDETFYTLYQLRLICHKQNYVTGLSQQDNSDHTSIFFRIS